ncbi:MAG: T9SS C-terminal target domain-containing protein, partial [Ignavibacteriae bacterium]
GIGDFNFKMTGSLLYRGDVSITHGRYEAIIPVPKDVTIGKNARISMYAWSGQADATGSTENVMIDGVDTTSVKDTEGPVMNVYLDTTAFRPGGLVKSNPVILVELEDESGINTSTVGVGHQLTATISSPRQVFDLSNYYHSSLDNYKKGEVRYPLQNLRDGKYSLIVKAWDVQNNSSEAETFFEVHAEDDFAILNAVNVPNPFSHSTTFTFQRASSDPIDVEIKIYSIAGRLIGTLSERNVGGSDVRIPWDGKDNDGSELANGIYFYKLITHEKNGSRSSEIIGKLAVMR